MTTVTQAVASVVVHRATFTSNTRKMSRKAVAENGTMRFLVENWPRRRSVRFRYPRYHTLTLYGK